MSILPLNADYRIIITILVQETYSRVKFHCKILYYNPCTRGRRRKHGLIKSGNILTTYISIGITAKRAKKKRTTSAISVSPVITDKRKKSWLKSTARLLCVYPAFLYASFYSSNHTFYTTHTKSKSEIPIYTFADLFIKIICLISWYQWYIFWYTRIPEWLYSFSTRLIT